VPVFDLGVSFGKVKSEKARKVWKFSSKLRRNPEYFLGRAIGVARNSSSRAWNVSSTCIFHCRFTVCCCFCNRPHQLFAYQSAAIVGLGSEETCIVRFVLPKLYMEYNSRCFLQTVSALKQESGLETAKTLVPLSIEVNFFTARAERI